MNRLILKYGYPITFVILAILAWVVYRIFSAGGSGLIGFVVVTVLVWGVGTVVFIYLWPTFAYSAYKRAIVQHRPGGPIPVRNCLLIFAQTAKRATCCATLPEQAHVYPARCVRRCVRCCHNLEEMRSWRHDSGDDSPGEALAAPANMDIAPGGVQR